MCVKYDNPAYFEKLGTGTGIGFELELLHVDGDAIIEEFIADYQTFPLVKGYLAALKEDPSVRGGEFITHPASLAEHRRRLPEFLRMVKSSGFYAEGGTTGLHVHVGCEVLGERANKSLKHLIAFSLFGGERWEELQRRVMGRWARNWAATGNPDAASLSTENPDFETRLCRADDWIETYAEEKFTRINLQHDNTLEFRQGSASTQTNRVLGRIEFALGLCEYAVERANQETYPVQSFEDEVADFIGFLKGKGYDAAVSLAQT